MRKLHILVVAWGRLLLRWLVTGPSGASRRLSIGAVVLMFVSTLGAPSAFADDVDTTDRVREMLEDGSTDATVGLYLKEVGVDAPHAAFNEGFGFEPASAIKALIHFHAMRQAEDETVIDGEPVTLDRLIPNPWSTEQGSCPQPTDPVSETLGTGLFEMMTVPPGNTWTQALRDFFGDAQIDATRQALGMDDTVLSHLIGCFVSQPPDGFTRGLDDPNQLTLVDAGKLYEEVATGFLADPDAAYALMVQGGGTFNTIIDEEADELGLSLGAVNAFKAERRSALKAGSYTAPGISQWYRTVAGWGELPYRDGSCAVAPRDFVFGAFIHNSSTAPTVNVTTAGIELFREQIRKALESWAACEADLEVVTVSVIDAPPELHVNTLAQVTVRTNVRNNGPAETVDATLTVTVAGPPDCDLSPAASNLPVIGMTQGDVVQVDHQVFITCSEPSFHTFRFDAEIEPANPNVEDPIPDNDTSLVFLTRAVIAHADLAVLELDLAEFDGAGLGDLLVDKPFTFDAPLTLHNLGDAVHNLYHDPVDATVSVSMDIPAGIRGSIQDGNIMVWVDGPDTISRDVAVPGLEVGADREITETFGIHCLEPGLHEIVFAGEISADDEHVLDPDPANNLLQENRTIDCVTPVQINIRPGNPHNFVNSKGNQSVPVAILTTDAGEYGLPLAFDATTVDHTTVRFGTTETLNAGGGAVASPDKDFIRDSFEMDDKTKDGDLDMVLLFQTPDTGINEQTTEACLVGTYQGADDVPLTFFGCDFVQVPPGKGK